MRKTIDVETVKSLANFNLKESVDDNVQGREAIQMMIERVLMLSGNYQGFQYLTANDMLGSGLGTTVGIQTDADGNLLPADAGRFDNVDHTRVRYF